MRIAQVTVYADLRHGGPSQKTHALSAGLQQRGHQVEVVTFRPGSTATNAYRSGSPVSATYLPWVGRGLLQAPLAVAPLAKAIRNADVVHCYGLYDLLCPLAVRMAQHVGRPYVIEPLGMYTPRGRNAGAKRLYHALFTRRMFHGAARVVANSPAEEADLRGAISPERLALRSNGIDVERYRNLPDGEPFRAALGLRSGERLVLYVGRISPIKNLETLVRAFSEAGAKMGPGDATGAAHLALVGPMLEEEYAGRVRREIAALGMERRVTMVGPLFGAQKLEALAAADLFVLPSLAESYGNAAAEAAAAGLPVLLTEGCGIAPLLHGRCGWAVPPTVAGLAEGLGALLAGGREQFRMSDESRQVLLAQLSWEEPLTVMERIYQECLVPGG